jgi:hypothetical protein
LPKTLGFAAFVIGIISLSVLIALSDWTKSRSTDMFTTLVGGLTLVAIIMNM